jgi:hypothetical protein
VHEGRYFPYLGNSVHGVRSCSRCELACWSSYLAASTILTLVALYWEKDLRRTLVGPTIRLYYDTVVAIALMAVFAIVCGFVAAVIAGGNPPNLTITGVAFLLAGAVWFFRLWRNSQASGRPPA